MDKHYADMITKIINKGQTEDLHKDIFKKLEERRASDLKWIGFAKRSYQNLTHVPKSKEDKGAKGGKRNGKKKEDESEQDQEESEDFED